MALTGKRTENGPFQKVYKKPEPGLWLRKKVSSLGTGVLTFDMWRWLASFRFLSSSFREIMKKRSDSGYRPPVKCRLNQEKEGALPVNTTYMP